MMDADALCESCEEGDVARISEHIAAGRPVDVYDSGYFGGTPLSYAAGHGHVAVERALLAAGARPSLPDRSDYTAAHLAARNGHAQVRRRRRRRRRRRLSRHAPRLAVCDLKQCYCSRVWRRAFFVCQCVFATC